MSERLYEIKEAMGDIEPSLQGQICMPHVSLHFKKLRNDSNLNELRVGYKKVGSKR